MSADNLDRTTPWYRQFWPWFLIALPASVVAASLVTVVIAVTHPDSLAVSDYGRIDELTARNRARDLTAAELGLSATLSYRDADATLVIDLNASRAPAIRWQPERLRLMLQHPSRQPMDTSLTLDHQAGGRYEARPVAWPQGRRYLEILPDSPADPDSAPWRLALTLDGHPGAGALVAAPPR